MSEHTYGSPADVT